MLLLRPESARQQADYRKLLPALNLAETAHEIKQSAPPGGYPARERRRAQRSHRRARPVRELPALVSRTLRRTLARVRVRRGRRLLPRGAANRGRRIVLVLDNTDQLGEAFQEAVIRHLPLELLQGPAAPGGKIPELVRERPPEGGR